MGNYEPFTIGNVGSYIQNLMQTTGQKTLIKKYNLQPFKVRALSVERTFCEKIMSLVRFSRVEDPFAALSNKIRHIYDLDQILNDGLLNSFFKSDDFSEMLQKVGKDDFISYKNNNAWLKEHPCSAIIFETPEIVWSHIQNTYRTIFKDLVIGDLPDENDLIETLKKIKNRMQTIGWTI